MNYIYSYCIKFKYYIIVCIFLIRFHNVRTTFMQWAIQNLYMDTFSDNYFG